MANKVANKTSLQEAIIQVVNYDNHRVGANRVARKAANEGQLTRI